MSEELNEGSPLDPNGQEEVLSEVESLKKALSEAKEKEKDVFDQLLRLTAEFQNFRKRSEARIIDSRKAGKEDVLLPIISLTDALIQAESSSRHATNVESLKKGLTMVLGQFEKFLADQGLVQIKAKQPWQKHAVMRMHIGQIRRLHRLAPGGGCLQTR